MRATTILLVLLLWCAAPAIANMAAPWREGDPAGEPVGQSLRDFHVLREELRLDLRPLADGAEAQVRAVYHLENRGPAGDLDLVFLGSGLSGAQVRADEVPVPAREVDLPELPPSWAPPKETPSLDAGERRVEFRDRSVKGLAFRVHLEPGVHRLEVRYHTAPPTYHPTGRVYREHQVVYLLAPARAWGSFGELSVRVDLPPGFAWRSNLELQAVGDRLEGRFPALPADHMALTVGLQGKDWTGPAGFGLGFLAVLLGGVAAWSWGRRTGEASRFARLLAGGGACLLGAVLGGGGFLAGEGVASQSLRGSQISSSWSYGVVLVAVGGTLATLVAGALVALGAFVVANLGRRPGPT